MPIDYRNYPANWKTHIRPAVLVRAGHKCEWCGVSNYARGVRLPDGSFVERNHGHGRIRIILTIAHLDGDLAHNDGMDTGGPALPLERANPVALCQRCHLRHDHAKRVASRAKRAAGQALIEGIQHRRAG